MNPWNLSDAQVIAMDELLAQRCAKRAAHKLGLSRDAFCDRVKKAKGKMGLSNQGVFAHILAWHDYRRANKESA